MLLSQHESDNTINYNMNKLNYFKSSVRGASTVRGAI